MYDNREALRAADSDVEAVWIEEEFGPTRRVIAARGGHGHDRDSCFLSLEFIDCPDLNSRGETLAEKIDLQIIRCDHEDVFGGQPLDRPVPAPDILFEEAFNQ